MFPSQRFGHKVQSHPVILLSPQMKRYPVSEDLDVLLVSVWVKDLERCPYEDFTL